jgi:hypothetical protein
MLQLSALETVLLCSAKESIKFQLVSNPDVNRIWKYLRWYANQNVNSKLIGALFCQNVSKNWLLLSTGWGHDG